MPRRRTLVPGLALLAGSALPLVAGAQGKPTVVVRQLVHGVGTTEADAERATRALAAGFAADSAVQAVQAPTTPARFVVSGVLMVMGGTRLDWRLVDTANGSVVANGVRTLPSSELTEATFRPLAGEIAGAAARTAAATTPKKP